MTLSTVGILTKMIPRVHNKPGKIVMQQRYYYHQRTFPNHGYGVWLETGCMKSFLSQQLSGPPSGPESEDVHRVQPRPLGPTDIVNWPWHSPLTHREGRDTLAADIKRRHRNTQKN